ncbi:MFS transporter [Paenibacillus sp. tmac-D7]|uniref:MFS transporter n=1 Tax=Paenibacillus sp. tmac-D7 TaxID=2591462 RepID=UPI0015E85DA6|nr:MFS transporter [Paenibacillus sp. tmac-D7]
MTVGNGAGAEKRRLSQLYFLYYAAVGIYMPYLALYLQQSGMNGVAIGSTMGLLPVIGVISPLFWGWLSDRWGKTVAVMAILLGGAAFWLILFMSMRQLLLTVAVLVLITLFINAYPSLLDGMTLSYLQTASGQYGRLRVWGSVGYGVGGMIATAVLWRLPMGSLFLTAALILLLGIAVTLRLKTASPSSADRTGRAQGPRGLGSAPFVLFLLMAFLLQVANSFYGSFFGIYIHDVGGTQSAIGIANVISSVCELPFFYYASTVVARFGALRTLSAAGLLYALRWGLLGAFPGMATAYSTQLLHGCTFCLYFAAAMDYIARSIPERSRTTGIAVFTAVIALAGILGNVMNGFLYDYQGLLSMPYASSLFAVLAGSGFIGLERHEARLRARGSLS